MRVGVVMREVCAAGRRGAVAGVEGDVAAGVRQPAVTVGEAVTSLARPVRDAAAVRLAEGGMRAVPAVRPRWVRRDHSRSRRFASATRWRSTARRCS